MRRKCECCSDGQAEVYLTWVIDDVWDKSPMCLTCWGWCEDEGGIEVQGVIAVGASGWPTDFHRGLPMSPRWWNWWKPAVWVGVQSSRRSKRAIFWQVGEDGRTVPAMSVG